MDTERVGETRDKTKGMLWIVDPRTQMSRRQDDENARQRQERGTDNDRCHPRRARRLLKDIRVPTE